MTQSPTPEELEGLLERASARPWRIVDVFLYPGEGIVAADDSCVAEMGHDGELRHPRHQDDALLTVAAVNALPDLLSRIRVLDERIRGLEEALENIDCAAAVSHNGTETRTLTYILEVTKGILDPARAALTLNKENDNAG